jgi:uncharacterized protein (DUF2132 family)
MEVQNYKLFQNYSAKNIKLHSLEKKHESIISLLRRECEKSNRKSEPQLTSFQRFWKKKQVESKYTVKLTENQKIKVEKTESFKHGWLQKNVNQNLQKTELRSRMIEAGNFFSMNNKTSSPSVKMQRNKSAVEVRQDMLVRAKELGNQYSLIFNKKDKLPRNSTYVDDLGRFHQLIAKKKEAEKFYGKSKKNEKQLSDLFVAKYSKMITEINRLGKNLKMESRVSFGELTKVL